MKNGKKDVAKAGLEGFSLAFKRLAERYPAFVEELGKLVA